MAATRAAEPSSPPPPYEEALKQAQNEREAYDAEREAFADLGSAAQSPVTPVHWLSSHHRRVSYTSIDDDRPAAITLEDHTEGDLADDDVGWAKAIYIEDYVIVEGNRPSVGSFVCWHCRIDTIEGGSMIIRKRYSEFYELRRKLLITFPKSSNSMPPFPPKTFIREFVLAARCNYNLALGQADTIIRSLSAVLSGKEASRSGVLADVNPPSISSRR